MRTDPTGQSASPENCLSCQDPYGIFCPLCPGRVWGQNVQPIHLNRYVSKGLCFRIVALEDGIWIYCFNEFNFSCYLYLWKLFCLLICLFCPQLCLSVYLSCRLYLFIYINKCSLNRRLKNHINMNKSYLGVQEISAG